MAFAKPFRPARHLKKGAPASDAPDVTAPSIVDSSVPVVGLAQRGDANATVMLDIWDAVLMNPTTLGVSNIQVTGPSGDLNVSAYAIIASTGAGKREVVKYTVDAPGGAWGPDIATGPSEATIFPDSPAQNTYLQATMSSGAKAPDAALMFYFRPGTYTDSYEYTSTLVQIHTIKIEIQRNGPFRAIGLPGDQSQQTWSSITQANVWHRCAIWMVAEPEQWSRVVVERYDSGSTSWVVVLDETLSGVNTGVYDGLGYRWGTGQIIIGAQSNGLRCFNGSIAGVTLVYADAGANDFELAGLVDALGNYTFADGGGSTITTSTDSADLPDATPIGHSLTIEGEEFSNLTNMVIEVNGEASSGEVIRESGMLAASAEVLFTGPVAIYTLTTSYFDENDGASTFAIAVNGQQIDAWTWDQDLGSPNANATTLTTRDTLSIELHPGDVIRISGTPDGGEALRVDKIDFTVTGLLSGGISDANVGEYTVSLVADEIADDAGNFIPSQMIGTFSVDLAVPVIQSFDAVDLGAGSDVYVSTTATVVIVDDVAVDQSGIVPAAFTVDGGATITDVQVVMSQDGTEATATLTITGPGGNFTGADDGTYTVSVLDGSIMDTSGNAVAGPAVLGTFEVAIQPISATRIECETMTLVEGFEIFTVGAAASTGDVIQSTGAPLSVAQWQSNLPDGTYTVTVRYFDENDGQASMALRVTNQGQMAGIDSWSWDQELGSPFSDESTAVSRNIVGVTILNGDVVELRGSAHQGELLRTDYLEFVRTGDPGVQPDPDPVAMTMLHPALISPSKNCIGPYAVTSTPAIVHVTNRNNSGPGSLREAVESGVGPRIIVFDEGGPIEISSELPVYGDIWICAQTAPEPVYLTAAAGSLDDNTRLVVRRGNVVVTGLACYPATSRVADTIFVNSNNRSITPDNVLVAWCSGIAGGDELNGQWENGDRVSFEYCIGAAALDFGEDGMPYASLGWFWGSSPNDPGNPGGGGQQINWPGAYRCLVGHINSRAMGFRNTFNAQVIECAIANIFNQVFQFYDSSNPDNYNGDFMGNVFIVGNGFGTSGANPISRIWMIEDADAEVHISNNWIYDQGAWSSADDSAHFGTGFEYTVPARTVTGQYAVANTWTRQEVYDRVQLYAGAFHDGARDSFSQGVVNQLYTLTGPSFAREDYTLYGSLPTRQGTAARADTDGDGIYDSYETARGVPLGSLNPHDFCTYPGWTDKTNFAHQAHFFLFGTLDMPTGLT